MTVDDNILDDLFHFCALRAYLEQAAIEGCFPDTEATRRRAYDLYAERSHVKTAPIRRSAEPDDGDR